MYFSMPNQLLVRSLIRPLCLCIKKMLKSIYFFWYLKRVLVFIVLFLGYVTNLVERAWSHLEGYSNDYTRIILSEIPEDLTHRTTKKLFLSMVKLLSNFDAVYEIVGKSTAAIENDVKADVTTTQKMTDETKYSQKSKKMISDFHDFFTDMILIDSCEKRQALLHAEQTHFFALNVLSCVITCLDTLLLLETKFHFKESLLSLQAMCKSTESNAFIIDQCSVKRNQILVMADLLGGISERFIPPDTLTMVRWFFFSICLTLFFLFISYLF